LVLFVIIVALSLGSVYATLRIVEWTGNFYSAIQKVDGPESLRQIGIFALIIALNSVRGLTAEYLRKILEIRWRKTLTDAALDLWTRDKAYWHLSQSATHRIDNPDQRIAEDCRLFVKGMLGEALDLIGRVVGLFSYLAVLWGLSNFPLSLAAIGIDLEIPRYMIWAAFIYVALSSGITHLLGRPLKGLLAEQQKREASFRFSMARWRTAFDEVALSGGEEAEKRIFRNRFAAISSNWQKLIRRELILGSFTFPFQHSVLRIPLFVALPGYLAGHVAFGGLMQLGTAFSSVVTTLSWFIFSYRDLCDLVATSSRLDNFMQAAKATHARSSTLTRRESVDGLALQAVSLTTPEGRPLLSVADFRLQPGETVWLRGISGIGKTTLVKAIAGLWPYGAGRIGMAAGDWMFLPQKAYLPLGTIFDAAAYPSAAISIGEPAIRRALSAVGLEHRASGAMDALPAGDIACEGLSGGELQRLGLARILIHQPDWVVLDEATSALDDDAEAHLLALLRQTLPHTAFVIIAHRPPQGIDGIRVIDLDHSTSIGATIPTNRHKQKEPS
jgi:putative ATP-binding cassette transporter